MLLPLWPLVRGNATEAGRTLQSCFRELATCVRGMASTFGVRPYRVYIETVTWTGAKRGQGAASVTTNEITEGPDNTPPKITWEDDIEVAFNDLSSGSVEIGPITPDYSDAEGIQLGGTKLSVLSPTPVDRNSTVRVKLVGPKHPDGVYFRISALDHHKGYTYMLTVMRASEGSVIA